jgi:hypothetical protein
VLSAWLCFHLTLSANKDLQQERTTRFVCTCAVVSSLALSPRCASSCPPMTRSRTMTWTKWWPGEPQITATAAVVPQCQQLSVFRLCQLVLVVQGHACNYVMFLALIDGSYYTTCHGGGRLHVPTFPTRICGSCMLVCTVGSCWEFTLVLFACPGMWSRLWRM